MGLTQMGIDNKRVVNEHHAGKDLRLTEIGLDFRKVDVWTFENEFDRFNASYRFGKELGIEKAYDFSDPYLGRLGKAVTTSIQAATFSHAASNAYFVQTQRYPH